MIYGWHQHKLKVARRSLSNWKVIDDWRGQRNFDGLVYYYAGNAISKEKCSFYDVGWNFGVFLYVKKLKVK